MKINFFGPLGPTGYGIITRFLTPALERQGLDVAVFPIYGLNIAEQETLNLINKVSSPDRFDADASIKLSVANPFEGLMFNGKKRIFYTMLEVDKIPEAWVKTLNRMDQVWTLSKWGAEVFKNSGVEREIKVVPGGVDLNLFNPNRLPLIEKQDKFRFLMVGKWEIRKGCDILCKAFAEEFKSNEDVELWLACNTASFFVKNFNIYYELLKLKLPSDRADIKVIDFIQNYRDMGRLYVSADCFVEPCRGEGWNLPLIEAMACGLPAIITDWSGHTEYVNEKNAILLKNYKLVQAKHPEQIYSVYLEQGRWAEPDMEEVKEKMRWAFEHREKIKKIGEKAASDMKNWTWDEAAKKAVKCLEGLT